MQQNNTIHPTAVIYSNVIIEDNVYIGAYCIIGAPAESLKHWDEPEEFSVIIRSGAKITGHVTIDAGTHRHTEIGKDSFIMKHSYIAHDCIIGKGVVLSAHTSLAGHVEVGESTNIGMGAMIHQWSVIPSGCMIGMGCVITKRTTMEKDSCYIGSPARFLRPN